MMIGYKNVFWLATLAYCGSFLLPACVINPPLSSDPEAMLYGWQVFINFIMLFISPCFYLAWLANPICWAGLRALREGYYRVSASAGLAALLTASVGMALFARTEENFLRYEAGSLVWAGSFVVLALGSLLCHFRESNGRSSDWLYRQLRYNKSAVTPNRQSKIGNRKSLP